MSEPPTIVITALSSTGLASTAWNPCTSTATGRYASLSLTTAATRPACNKPRRAFPNRNPAQRAQYRIQRFVCNRGGCEAAQSRYAVLLNDDTRVTPGWLQPMVERAESDPRVAACQPKLLSAVDDQIFDYGGGAGGYIDALGYTFCRGRLLDRRERDCGQYDREVPLFWACGSALFLRVEAARRLGFLDLDYYMHFEEIDLCWRLQLRDIESGRCPAL